MHIHIHHVWYEKKLELISSHYTIHRQKSQNRRKMLSKENVLAVQPCILLTHLAKLCGDEYYHSFNAIQHREKKCFDLIQSLKIKLTSNLMIPDNNYF